MPSAITLITATNLSATSLTFSFTSIPSTYDDLLVKMSLRSGDNGERLLIWFNSSTSNYTLSTFGIALTSLASYSRASFGDNHLAYIASSTAASSNIYTHVDLYFPSYRSSNYKTLFSDALNDAATSGVYTNNIIAEWAETAAITSLNFRPGSANFVPGSTFSLYGIKNS